MHMSWLQLGSTYFFEQITLYLRSSELLVPCSSYTRKGNITVVVDKQWEFFIIAYPNHKCFFVLFFYILQDVCLVTIELPNVVFPFLGGHGSGSFQLNMPKQCNQRMDFTRTQVVTRICLSGSLASAPAHTPAVSPHWTVAATDSALLQKKCMAR